MGGAVEADHGPLVSQALDGTEVALHGALGDGHLPLGEVDVPQRAVAALGGVPAQHVEGVEPVQDGGVQSLPVGVVGAGLAVGEGGQGGSGRGGAIVLRVGALLSLGA